MLTIGSLFTGGGGLDMAVKMLWPDARIAWTSEFDKAASKLLAARYLLSPNHGDITAIDWTQVEPVDVLVGGFPCQDISHAGKRAGITEETRSGLWFHFRDAIRHLRPRLVLVENVAAITAAGGGLDVVLGSLAEIGFDAEWGLLRASDVGACHGRDRWFAVAYDPDRAGGREAFQHDGGGTTPVHGSGVPHEPDRHADGSGPERSLTLLSTPQSRDYKGRPGDGFNTANLVRDIQDLLPTPRSSDGPHGGPNQTGDSLQPFLRELLPTPTVAYSRGARNLTSGRSDPDSSHHSVTTLNDVAFADMWREYEPAIRRHERVFGRPAPYPVDDKCRLSPAFVEWMMGWPQGWVDLDGLSRANRLKILGNGVVPQQAAAAFGQLIGRVARQEAAA